MTFLGNILWLIFGGFLLSIAWFFVGLFWCISIIGIPVGLQCFKFAKLSLSPFGKEIKMGEKTSSFILNIIWIILGGFGLALGHLISALVCAITIIGIPFAKQHLKFAQLALFPFGTEIITKY